MSLCALCGFEMSGSFALCPHHHCIREHGWAETNRIMCDLVHRGKVPPRLPETQREEELVTAGA
jgi:hypothetical protein